MQVVVPKMEKPFSIRGTKFHPGGDPERYLEKLARVALHESLELAAILGVDGVLLECNRATLEAAGITREGAIGKPLYESGWFGSSTKARGDISDAIRRAAGGEHVRYATELSAAEGSTATRTVEFTLAPIRDDDGRVALLLLQGRDITDKTELERELASQREELANNAARLADHERLKEEFLASLAHELRNPLAPIRTGVHVLRRSGSNPALLEKVSLVMERQLEHLVHLVDNFLDAFRKSSVKLELSPPPPQAPRLPGQDASGVETRMERARHRILVVDDNRDSAEMLATMLQVWGHQVTLAHDGLRALESGQSLRPRVAFLDIGMPILNGYETARRIRRQAWGKHVTLVAVTGLGHEDDKRRSREAGFDAHLVKPVDLADVELLLSRLTDSNG